MTAGDLKTRLFKRLGEDSSAPTYYTNSEVLNALNAAERLFCLITLCLESTAVLTLSAGVAWYLPLSTLSNWLLPLRMRITGGAKLEPARLEELDALSLTWEETAGTPSRYCSLGWNLLAFYKQPASGGTTIDVTYARGPAAMTTDASTPEIPEEYQPCLVECAIPFLRIKEGGQEFTKSLYHFDSFLKDAAKMALFVRARNLSQRYDKLPFELESFDRSKLLKLAMKQQKPAALDIPQAAETSGG